MEELNNQYQAKSIAELDHIVRNASHHTPDQLRIASEVIAHKRSELKKTNTIVAGKIDELIRKEKWFDFQVLSFDGRKLIIAGGIDLTYYHQLEVIFEDVFFVSAYFQGWHSNTETIVFRIPPNELELHSKYQINEDYQLFIFHSEDDENDIIIAANSVSFNSDTVYYYDRQDLKTNERIADFVKKNAL